jgi:chromosome transmission fidelity protein 4
MIYSTSIKKVICRHSSESIPSCIAFSPSENLLAWTCLDGSLVRVPDVIPAEFPGPNAKISEKREVSRTSRKVHDPLDDANANMDYEHGWVIDDLGDAFKDEPAHEHGDSYTKEMGRCCSLSGRY